jgi:TIR domain-containing protein
MTVDEEIPWHIADDGTMWVPSGDLPTELTLVSFRRDLLLMPSIMLSRFPQLERSRPVRLTGVSANFLRLTEDEINVLGTRQVLIVASGGFVHILPDSNRLHEAKREAHAVVERALNPGDLQEHGASNEGLVVISYANQDRAYADLLAGHMRALSINAWHYVPFARFGAMLVHPLERALRDASALAVLMSPHSSASSAVQREVQIAIANDLRILPILLGGRPLPALAHLAYFDARNGELPPEKLLRQRLFGREPC